jgi:tetratricopeptide (TPR) repeat protein/predicted Ser/Thr protein kinase
MSEFREGARVAGRFSVLSLIGEGGMGSVYKALQESLDRIVALKVLQSNVAFTPRARRRFGREARAVARLNHPYIAAVYDFGTDNDDQTLWLAMEYVDGKSMTHMKRDEPDLGRLLSVTDQILSSLSAAHARGIIHRDLKPSNILLTHDDEKNEVSKLVDFGLAATHSDAQRLSLENAPGGLDEATDAGKSVLMGTPRYMAPEIFRRQPMDQRVDLYALGVILYEIICGTPPYPGDDPRKVMRGHLKKPIPRLHPREGYDIPPEFEKIIYKLLAKDPDERYSDANDVRSALQRVVADLSFGPWAAGAFGDTSGFPGIGNISNPGFLSAYGAQTIPPALVDANAGDNSRGGFVGAQSPLVGRETERRTIENYVRKVIREGTGALVFVEGEEGIGKSRLAQWMSVRVEESGVMRAIEGTFNRNAGGFDGVRAVLDHLLGTSEVAYDSLGDVIYGKLKRWRFAEDEIETAIELMRPENDDTLFEQTGPATDRRVSQQERVFAVIERIFRHVARERPLLVIFENFHLASDTTFAFLEHLAVGLHLDPSPILIVGTIRREEVDSVPKLRESLQRLGRFGTDVHRMKLGPLSLDEAAALATKLLPVADELADRLAERSGGNALHLVQILRYLRETDKIRYEDEKWRLAPGVDLGEEVPDELSELMRYRIDRVAQRFSEPNIIRHLLERCAILGPRFDYRLLKAFVEADEQGEHLLVHLDEALEHLVKENIIREVGHSAEDVLEFQHTLMRDVLLKDLDTRRTIRRLHALAAEVKVAFYGSRSRQHGLEIAEHYRRARHMHGVYYHTVKAAQSAMSTSDLKQAVRLYRDARELADLEDAFEDGLEQMESMQEVSTVLRSDEVSLEVANLELRLAEYDAARDHYRGLLRSDDWSVAAWSRWGLGELALKQGELDEAEGWFEAAVKEATGHDDDPAEQILARARFGLGTVKFLRGDIGNATDELTEALNQAQQLSDKKLEGDILRTLAGTVFARGDIDRAEIYRRRASILAEANDDREAMAHMALHNAQHYRQVGNPTKGEESATEAMRIYEDIGKRHWIAHCLLELGTLAFGRGNYKDSAKFLREAHRLYEAFEDRRGLTHCKYRLARLAYAIRKPKETQTLLREAMEGYRAMGDLLGVARCHFLVGRAEHLAGRAEHALSIFESVAQDLAGRGDRMGAAAARAYAVLEKEKLGQTTDVDSEAPSLVREVESLGLAEEALAAALDELSERLNARDPILALELDTAAEKTWGLLGRPIV